MNIYVQKLRKTFWKELEFLEALHYSIDASEICFFCPCIHDATKSHHAEINVNYYTWNCSEKPDEYDGRLENKHLIWFEKKDPGGGEHLESQHLTVDNIVREVDIKKEVLDQHCSSEVLQEIEIHDHSVEMSSVVEASVIMCSSIIL